jgi:putative peptidoglycan binding protein
MSKSKKHRIKQGECLASLANEARMLRDHVWEDAANEQLRDDRDPFLLRPGDLLAIPDPDPKEESRTTENRHRFRRVLEPTKLRIRILENDEPRAEVPWTLLRAGRIVAEGTTNDDGEIETDIDPRVKKLTLQFGPKDKLERYHLLPGSLNPLKTVSGVQARLTNLGIDPGPVDDILGPLTKGAVRLFQHEHDLVIDGIIGNATRGALRDAYGC